MLRRSRWKLSLVLVSLYLSVGCGDQTNSSTNNFPVVVFSDVHFNPFYDTSLFPALLAADAAQWESIFKASAMKTPSSWGSDTNYPLLVMALSSIRHNLGAGTLIIYTGDLLGHYLPTTFFELYGSRDVSAMQTFTEKTVTFVTSQVRLAVGNIPVVFALGNIDSYTGQGADSTFLAHTADTFYTQFLNSTVDHQTFLSSFTAGGYYSAEPLGKKMTVISLNTTPLSPLIPANLAPNNNDVEVNEELGWLDAKLASAEAAGQKVWLLMHVPPGADTFTTSYTLADFNANGSLKAPTMMWVPTYQDSFLQILSKYPGLITLMLGAHTHMDEYRVMSSSSAMDQIPAISPVFGNNPAFKLFTFSHETFTPVDYTSFTYDLSALPTRFTALDPFSVEYSMQGPLDASLIKLYPALVKESPERATYIGRYTSGNASYNPATQASWNLITPSNWPLFSCGIKNMAQQDVIDCVNSF